MVKTDGHRLAYVSKPVETEGVMDTLIPRKALLELVKLARVTAGDIQFGEDPNHLFFETEGRLLISRKLSGNFPNFEMVMPKNNDHQAVFDLDDMRSAVRRISLMADERNRSIRMTVREGEVEVTAASSEEGEGSEAVPADYKGEEIQLGFNSQYLLDFLNNVGSTELVFDNDKATDAVSSAPAQASAAAAGSAEGKATGGRESRSPLRISFEFKDANAQTQMTIAGDTPYDYRYVVMPLRI
jgi:DNA polymerase-3 subunit beta